MKQRNIFLMLLALSLLFVNPSPCSAETEINLIATKYSDGQFKLTKETKPPEELKIHGEIPPDFQGKENWEIPCFGGLLNGAIKNCVVGRLRLTRVLPTIIVAPGAIYEVSLKEASPNSYEPIFKKITSEANKPFIEKVLRSSFLALILIQLFFSIFSIKHNSRSFLPFISLMLSLLLSTLTCALIDGIAELPGIEIVKI